MYTLYKTYQNDLRHSYIHSSLDSYPINCSNVCLAAFSIFGSELVNLHISTNRVCVSQEYGVDEVEKLLRRPKSNAKERLMEVFLEFVASCK